MRSRVSRALLASVIPAVLFVSFVAKADKVSDFKAAVDEKGCKAIPYPVDREYCQKASSTKDRVCKDYSCDALRGQLDRKLDALKNAEKELAKAKEKLKAAQNETKNRAAKVIAAEEDVKQAEKPVAKAKTELAALKADAATNLKTAEACADARERVQACFTNARKKVAVDGDPKIKPYVSTLVSHFLVERDEHVTPLNEVRGAVKTCRALVSERIPD